MTKHLLTNIFSIINPKYATEIQRTFRGYRSRKEMYSYAMSRLQRPPSYQNVLDDGSLLPEIEKPNYLNKFDMISKKTSLADLKFVKLHSKTYGMAPPTYSEFEFMRSRSMI